MRKIIKSREISSFLFLAGLIFLVGLINPSFWQPVTIINCFNDSVVFTFLSAGIAFVILTGEIDVSIGAVLGLSAAVGATLLRDGYGIAAALFAAVIVGTVVGVINGIGVALLNNPTLIFTLGQWCCQGNCLCIHKGRLG